MKKIGFLVVLFSVFYASSTCGQCKEVNKANLKLRKGYPDEAIAFLKQADSLFSTVREEMNDSKCLANYPFVYAASYLKKAVDATEFPTKLLYVKKSDEYFQKFYNTKEIAKAIKVDGDAQFEQLGILMKNVAVDAYSEDKMATAYEFNKRSIEIFKQVNPKKIDNPLKFNTAICAVGLQKYDEALPYLEDLIEAKYEDRLATAYRLKSQCQLAIGEKEAAAATLDSAMAAFPEDNNLKLQALNLMMETGKSDLALETVNKILETEQTRADLYIVQAQLFYAKEEYEKARAAYEAAREIDPTDEYALYGIGVYHVKKSNDIVTEIDKAESDEEIEGLKEKLQSRYEKAVYYLLQAHEVDPSDKATIKTLIRVYRSMGNEDKAVEFEGKL